MKQFIKNHGVIILAFALPVTLIIVVALIAYLPSFFISTKYNFVYVSCVDGTNYDPYLCTQTIRNSYTVVDGKITLTPIDPNTDKDKDGILDSNEKHTAHIFLHDTQKNESREISLEEAKTFELNSLLTSPDGVTISSNYDRGAEFFLLFNGGSHYGTYLTKGNAKKELNLINKNERRYYYQDGFQFIGWVLPGRN